VSRRVTVLGAGYLGATHAACLAELGFDVLGLDVDPARVARLNAGDPPFFEPGLAAALRRARGVGRLRFTTSYRRAAAFADLHFVCVGTPQRAGADAADLSQLDACIDALAPLLTAPCLVVGKCTVPVGTADMVSKRLSALSPAGPAARLVWNPEFLREGSALNDTLHPDRIVVGAATSADADPLREIYARALAAGVPFLVTDFATAELVKVAANAFLATKISFINAMAEVCEAAGADVTMLAQALAHDERIGGRFLRPGLGFGGGCLPKDIRAFLARADELGVGSALSFLREVDAVNQRRRTRMVQLATRVAGGSFDGRVVGVLGAAFKPGSDDIRDSPALDVAQAIHDRGARVTVTDPAALANARLAHPDLRYASTALEAVRGAHVVLLLTEWPQYCDADPGQLGRVVAQRNIIDARGVLTPDQWQAAGWRYHALGRP
jgi:UDPglucose 6-dehydrogenase